MYPENDEVRLIDTAVKWTMELLENEYGVEGANLGDGARFEISDRIYNQVKVARQLGSAAASDVLE